MRILVIGQCTLQIGRLEYGNIGNYYIIEPLFRELHRTFPQADIVTSFQMTDQFCRREDITSLPIDIYFSWDENSLDTALKELAIADVYSKTGELCDATLFIQEVMRSDLIIDFSGDMWGENANLLGENRFLVGLLKDRVVQLLGRPIAMIAGSPGPFHGKWTEFAVEVFKHFNLVTNREQLSLNVLTEYGFENKNVMETACPAFLFERKSSKKVEKIIEKIKEFKKSKPVVGLIICGWNMTNEPFGKWPRDEYEYDNFVKTVEYLENKLKVRVLLMSHSNGFERSPEFRIIHGRDFMLMEQLYKMIKKKTKLQNVFLLDDIYLPSETKAIINEFDMLISGRIHAAVAGWSQYVPTVVLDYGQGPKAHKLQGFSKIVGFENLIADPRNFSSIKSKIDLCWNQKEKIRNDLEKRIPIVKQKAMYNFELLKQLIC